MFKHPTKDVLVELDPSANYLMMVDTNGIDNYELARPILTINQTDPNMIGKEVTLGIIGISSDPVNPNVIYCVEQL